jgi:hypothetical protein
MRVALVVGLLLSITPVQAWAQHEAGSSPEERRENLAGQSSARRLTAYVENWTPERIDRAERVSVLANSGRCSEGVKLARDEDDNDMADALVEACEERFERADRLAAAANTGRCDQAIEKARRELDAPMAEVLSEICERVELARRSATPEELAAARVPAPMDLRTVLVGEWSGRCGEDADHMTYADDGTVRINRLRGRWSIEDGLLVETFRTMIPGSMGDRGRLTQRSRISREGRYGLRKQVVYRSPGSFPPDVVLYRCDGE